MIIGLTGKNAAGKGESAAYLQSKGFFYHSLSDALREIASQKGLDHSRETLIALGKQMRLEQGDAFLAIKTNEIIEKQRKIDLGLPIVIDSIRSPIEVKELQKNKEFTLVSIDAPIEARFERIQ